MNPISSNIPNPYLRVPEVKQSATRAAFAEQMARALGKTNTAPIDATKTAAPQNSASVNAPIERAQEIAKPQATISPNNIEALPRLGMVLDIKV